MQNLLHTLRQIDACALSDALDSFGLQGVAEGIERRSGGRIAGRVRTMKLVRAGSGPNRAVHLGATSIADAEPGGVIVIEQASGVVAAAWGGLLASAALARQVQGIVVEGPVRDVDDYLELEFPVFSRSVTPRTARGRIVEACTDQPVSIGGITVEPGDYVVADGSGVVFVPSHRAKEVVGKARRIMQRESFMRDAVDSGSDVRNVLDANYEEMLQKTAD